MSESQLRNVAPLARELFNRLNYRGHDGALVWRVAALVEITGGLPLAWAMDAAEGVRQLEPDNPVGYFRTSLAEICSRNGCRLDALIASIVLPSGHRAGPPAERLAISMPPLEPRKPRSLPSDSTKRSPARETKVG